MGSCGVGGESGVREQEPESDPGSLPHCPVFTSPAWLGLIPAFANYLGESLPLSGPPFLSVFQGERATLLFQWWSISFSWLVYSTQLPHQVPRLASYHGLAVQWDYGVMAVLTYIDVFHPVIFRV